MKNNRIKKFKYDLGGVLGDPPKKKSQMMGESIVKQIDTLAASGKSYDEIIQSIDGMLRYKDDLQKQEGAQYGKPVLMQTLNRQPSNVPPTSTLQDMRLFQLGGSLTNLAVGMIQTGINQEINKHKVSTGLDNHYSQVSNTLNPYGLRYGGEITGSKTHMSYGGDLSHEKGGIKVSTTGLPSNTPDAEVESKETTVRIGQESYVFSDKLKL